jgi:multiple sugar transport system ATP-binding protein
MAQVVLENVVKRCGEVEVNHSPRSTVHGIDLYVQDREFVVLVGPSGCAKSTALRMVAGLEEITEGTIRIGDRAVNQVPPQNRNVAMVFQDYALYPHMSGQPRGRIEIRRINDFMKG